MRETSKLTAYRSAHGYNDYFSGVGIDIGCGDDLLDKSLWPNITDIRGYDLKDGDANKCANIADNTYDFVYSSHCLEHMHDPEVALTNWIRITKPGGFIIAAVPHEVYYEKCKWPSRFNGDHKTSWMLEFKSNLPKSVFIPDFLAKFKGLATVVHVETVLEKFDFTRFDLDQTMKDAVCQIEIVLRKFPLLTDAEIVGPVKKTTRKKAVVQLEE